MVGPKGDGVTANHFHLNHPSGIVFFHKISGGVWVVSKGADKFITLSRCIPERGAAASACSLMKTA
jgi:hypothetical protein